MDNVPQEHLDDDFAERIIPIPTEDGEETPLPPEQPRKRRLSPRQRTILLRLSVLVNLLLLILLVLPGSLGALHSMAQGIYNTFSPAPTPTVVPGSNTFYMDMNVPWTSVTLDGHQIQIPTTSTKPPLTLSSGHHRVEWRADPFQPQSCVIAIPDSTNSTCRFASVESFHSSFPAQLLLLHESLDTLSANQRRGLFATAQAAMKRYTPGEMVRAGESYRTQQGFITAAQPLQATLHFQLDLRTIGGEVYAATLQGCQALCSLPWQLRQSQYSGFPSQEWLALAVVAASWDYTSQDGHAVALGQPTDQSNVVNSAHPVLLGINWQEDSWKVEAFFSPNIGPPIDIEGTSFTDDPACVAGQNLLLGIVPHFSQIRFVSGTNPAAGCLAVVVTTPTVAIYMERFGVLLAVNDEAHRAHPQLPLADTYEQSLADQLEALPGQIVDVP